MVLIEDPCARRCGPMGEVGTSRPLADALERATAAFLGVPLQETLTGPRVNQPGMATLMTSNAGLFRRVHDAACGRATAGMPKYEELQNLYCILFYTSLCSPAQGCVQCVWLL